MVKRVFAICGLILFLSGIGFALYLFTFYLQAVTLDKNFFKSKVVIVNSSPVVVETPQPSPSPISATAIAQVQATATELATNLTSAPILRPCLTSWKIDVSNRVISENDSLTLKVGLSNAGNPKSCIVTLSLNAPGFSLDIPTREERIGLFPNEANYHALWILIPTKPGSFEVEVSIESVSLGVNGPVPLLLDSQAVGITVTNSFGLSPWLWQLLSYLGIILGPILSLGWWYDRWHEHKVKKEEKVALVKQTKIPLRSKRKARNKH